VENYPKISDKGSRKGGCAGFSDAFKGREKRNRRKKPTVFSEKKIVKILNGLGRRDCRRGRKRAA